MQMQSFGTIKPESFFDGFSTRGDNDESEDFLMQRIRERDRKKDPLAVRIAGEFKQPEVDQGAELRRISETLEAIKAKLGFGIDA